MPNNAYRNTTFASRLRGDAGHDDQPQRNRAPHRHEPWHPNAFSFFGIADDSSQKRNTTYASAVAQSQISTRVTSTVRFSVADQDYHFVNLSPTGERSDPSPFANFPGNTTTITGGNGFTVTGRGILDFSDDYPSTFDLERQRRRLLHADSSVHRDPGSTSPAVSASRTSTAPPARHPPPIGRTRARLSKPGARRSGTSTSHGGLGFDHNKIFGNAWSPRVSVAAYLRQPSARETLGDTKLTFNAGKGIKEPSLGQELSSLFVLVPPDTASALGLEPIGPERSRGVDVGIEQGSPECRDGSA